MLACVSVRLLASRNHHQATVVETAQFRQCKYGAESSKVDKGVGITPRQRLHSIFEGLLGYVRSS
jgi:hypothetical protein